MKNSEDAECVLDQVRQGPGNFRDLYNVKNAKISLAMRKQMNAALDVTAATVGPDTSKIAELVVIKHQSTGLLWAEEANLKLNRHEGIWDALRRNSALWMDSKYKDRFIPSWMTDEFICTNL
jgi:hypothetical protein